MTDWEHASRSNKQVYQIRAENTSIVLNSTNEASPKDMGAAKQVVSPEAYRGHRVRFKAELSTKNSDSAGLWLTASHEDWQITDGMYDRLVKGNSDWQSIELVIDVPVETTYISYGLWMIGTGTSKMRKPIFDVVEESVPVTTDKIWDRISPNKWVERHS